MHQSLTDAIDVIDAAVFSGDTFVDDTDRESLRDYLARWERGLKGFDELDDNPPLRLAIATNGRSLDDVAQFLPDNYKVVAGTLVDGIKGALVVGHDHLGWTMEGYVIPRLSSALITCKEILGETSTG